MWLKANYKYVIFFILTFITTTFAGIEWIAGKTFIANDCGFKLGGDVTWSDIQKGLLFSVPFILILTFHEFGHYFTAKYYNADVTLPFYIPLWFFGLTLSIGTMGAFIKIRSPLKSTKEFFDVGVAGPLAGFFVAIAFIWYGFATLPEPDYIYQIHPDYEEAYTKYGVGTDIVYTHEYQKEQYIKKSLVCNPGADPVPPEQFESFALGDNLLFMLFRWIFEDKSHLIPNAYEIFHYPFLFAGYLACFVTALNLIPIGQLDGGHVMYGLLGYKKFNTISPYIYKLFIFYAGLGLITPNMLQNELLWYIPLYLYFLHLCFKKLYPNVKERLIWAMGLFISQYMVSYLFPNIEGYPGYLLFGLVIGVFLGIKHPPALIEHKIDSKRKWIGWLAIIIFILCFPPQFFVI